MAVRNRVGIINARWMMTDDAEKYFSVWVAVFGLGPRKLLCTWHVDWAWRGALNSIKNKEVAAKVYHNVRVLIAETDIDTFTTMFQKISAHISTIMYVESFHRTLKYICMKGRTNKRIDNLIHILLNVSRDKGFEQLCKLERGKVSGWNTETPLN